MKLLKPSPEFCIKTSLKGKNDLKFTSKLFINVCSTEEIQRPTFETLSKEGSTGQNWKIPHITNKPRYDQDNKKNVCSTIDVAFHPYTFDLMRKNPQFEKLVCSTAIDSTEKQIKERNEVISKDYKILKKIKCKGGEPSTMAVRGERLKNPEKNIEDYNEKRQQEGDYAPKLFQEFVQKQRENKEKKIEDEEIKREKDERNEKLLEEKIKIEDLETDKKQQIECPKYKIFYSYETEYLVLNFFL